MSLSKGAMTPLSSEEKALLESLLIRAKFSAGETGDHPNEPGASSVSDWSLLTGQMSDASKRLHSPDPEKRSKAYCGTSPVPTPLPSGGSISPDAFSEKTFGYTRRGQLIALPPGVNDLQSWGRTVLDFGKYMSRGWTYEKFLLSEEADVKNYVKWCKGQVDSADGFLRDFGMYIMAYEYSPLQGPLIPGTTHARKMR